MTRALAVCAAAAMMMCLACVAYAAEVGGIPRNIQIWVDGDRTSAVLDIRGSSYTLTYEDSDGVSHQMSGGGVAFENDGTERPLTEEEIIRELNSPDVEYRDDGSVWLCCRGEETEITDRFDEKGVCYVQIETNEGPLYVTVKYGNGLSYSPHSYVKPDSFNTGAE